MLDWVLGPGSWVLAGVGGRREHQALAKGGR
jgi:hypothetical protein